MSNQVNKVDKQLEEVVNEGLDKFEDINLNGVEFLLEIFAIILFGVMLIFGTIKYKEYREYLNDRTGKPTTTIQLDETRKNY